MPHLLLGGEPHVNPQAGGTGCAKLLAKLRGSGNTLVSFGLDGHRILTSSDTEARVWDAKTFKPLTAPFKSDSLIHLAQFTTAPEGVFVATEKGAFLFSIRTGEWHLVFKAAAPAWPVAISPAGRLVALGTKAAGESHADLRLYDLTNGKEVGTFRHAAAPEFVVFSPDGQRLVSVERIGFSSRRKFHLWDVKTGRELCTPIQTDYDYNCEPLSDCAPAAFSPDGRRLAIASLSWFNLYDGLNGKLLVSLLYGPSQGLQSVEFTADGTGIVAIQSGRAVLCDPATLKPRFRGVDLDINAHSLSPDGKLLACSFGLRNDAQFVTEHGTGVYDLVRRKKVCSLGTSNAAPVAFSPDGRRVATGGEYDSEDTFIWGLPPEAGRQ